jgi:membrane fusion protein (multidrug efflux system)
VPNSFPNTLRALDAKSQLGSAMMALGGVALFGVWLAWSMLGRVAVLQRSDSARVEVIGAARPVAATVGGRVIASHLVLGNTVRKGDVLVELEGRSTALEIAELRADSVELVTRISGRQTELEAEERTLVDQRAARVSAGKEGDLALADARAKVALAEAHAQRTLLLRRSGGAAEQEVERASAEAVAARAAALALAERLRREDSERAVAEGDREVRISGFRRELGELRVRVAALGIRLRRFTYEADRQRIRAPVSGRIGEVATVEAGSLITAGTRIASVVPHGGLRIVAAFPSTALGRIRPGQSGRLRLRGYPSAQYGSAPVRVMKVAVEPWNDRFRVELEFVAEAGNTLPLHHGSPGDVEVQVERISPFALMLRTGGRAAPADSVRRPAAQEPYVQ